MHYFLFIFMAFGICRFMATETNKGIPLGFFGTPIDGTMWRGRNFFLGIRPYIKYIKRLFCVKNLK
jgi:hypothetical protein